MSKHSSIAIIPARGGSKGLKRKNIRQLCGKPLLAYSIEAARASSRIDRVVVSTEDEEIAEVAQRYGAEVPFLRPRRFAGDKCSPSQAIDHLLRTLYGKSPTISVVLYPTHPFRPKGLLDFLVGKVADEGFQHALTVTSFNVRADSFFKLGEGERLLGMYPPLPPGEGSCATGCVQDFGTFHRPLGLASVHWFNPCRVPDSFFFHPVTDKISLIDIDYLEDFLLAEMILDNNLFEIDKPCAS